MPSPAPDPARRSERARKAILLAARELLLDGGLAQVTVEGIAARASVGKQTIYRWWPTKSAVVFDAILESALGPDGTPALPDTGSIGDDLRTVTRAIVAELAHPPTDRMQRTVLAEIQHDPALAAELTERLLRPQTDAIVRRLEAAQRVGQLRRDVDLELAVEALLGPIFHRWLLRTAALDAAYADRVVDQTLAGLAPR